ncbi:MAG: efflux RND transporter periplasmic adaptor subunit, partial [Candidatus Omnitrophica bacterium]|nr:efflux RND transporter periplasmic adaptor subunit [Candidatus Omnitrophota bacterium]
MANKDSKKVLSEFVNNIIKPNLAKARTYLSPREIKRAITSIDIRKIDLAKLKKNYIWILLGVLIASLILVHTVSKIKQVFFGAKEKKEAQVEVVTAVPVKVYKVKRMDFKDSLPVMGRIEGIKEVELKFDSKGIMESFNFEEGERILEGDIIASLDQKDALIKLKYASLELDKAKKLFELGGIDQLALTQKQLEYESSKRELEKTNIYAPSDGYLGSKEKSVGSFVTSNDKIGIFVDFKEVYAVFDVIEEDSPKMALGQNAEIYLDAYPGASYAGTVDMISPIIEGRTRTQKIRVELKNERGELKPGMFARAVVNTYEKKDALIIPASAFKKQENKYFVYVVTPAGEAEKKEAPQGEELTGEQAEGQKEAPKEEPKKELTEEQKEAEKLAEAALQGGEEAE